MYGRGRRLHSNARIVATDPWPPCTRAPLQLYNGGAPGTLGLTSPHVLCRAHGAVQQTATAAQIEVGRAPNARVVKQVWLRRST